MGNDRKIMADFQASAEAFRIEIDRLRSENERLQREVQRLLAGQDHDRHLL